MSLEEPNGDDEVEETPEDLLNGAIEMAEAAKLPIATEIATIGAILIGHPSADSRSFALSRLSILTEIIARILRPPSDERSALCNPCREDEEGDDDSGNDDGGGKPGGGEGPAGRLHLAEVPVHRRSSSRPETQTAPCEDVFCDICDAEAEV